MAYILITDIDHSGQDVLICETRLDHTDIWLTLINAGRDFGEVTYHDTPPDPVPDNMSLEWLTPRGEYDIERNIALRTPSLAPFFPPWEETHKPARRRASAR